MSTPKTITINLGDGRRVTIWSHGESGAVETNLFVTESAEDQKRVTEGDDGIYNAAIDGVCSTLLALHLAGIDIDSHVVEGAVETVIDSIENEYGD
jgi:hypothetical protein